MLFHVSDLGPQLVARRISNKSTAVGWAVNLAGLAGNSCFLLSAGISDSGRICAALPHGGGYDEAAIYDLHGTAQW